jgi:hypothetical protein
MTLSAFGSYFAFGALMLMVIFLTGMDLWAPFFEKKKKKKRKRRLKTF